MQNEFYSVNQGPRQFIYLDNNILRLLLRDSKFWDDFFESFHKKDPKLFEDIQFIFTWSQLLELLNLGTIINEIRNSSLWKANLEGKNIYDNKAAADWLDDYFERVRNIIIQMPQLQRSVLMEGIDRAMTFVTHTCAEILAEETILKAKRFIEANDYMEDLSFKLAWAIITSHDFIVSNKQWLTRNDYFSSLIALWHKLVADKRELTLYRLIDKRYNAYINYSPNLEVGDAELTKDIFEALKPGSDLCDGEIINFSYRGYCDENTQRRCPVIGITGITRDRDVKKIKNRMSVMKQTFIELQRDVEGWNIANEPAEIFSLTIINKKIINIERTPY